MNKLNSILLEAIVIAVSFKDDLSVIDVYNERSGNLMVVWDDNAVSQRLRAGQHIRIVGKLVADLEVVDNALVISAEYIETRPMPKRS